MADRARGGPPAAPASAVGRRARVRRARRCGCARVRSRCRRPTAAAARRPHAGARALDEPAPAPARRTVASWSRARSTPPAPARVDGLVDNLEAAGVPVEVAPRGRRATCRGAARRAIVVLLGGRRAGAGVDALIAERRRAGLPTVVDLGPPTSSAADRDGDGRAVAAGRRAARATPAVLVVAPAGARAHGRRAGRGARVARAPDAAHPRPRGGAARRASAGRRRGAALVIGWRLGSGGEPRRAYADAVAEGIAAILAEQPRPRRDRRRRRRVPAALRGHERVTVVAGGRRRRRGDRALGRARVDADAARRRDRRRRAPARRSELRRRRERHAGRARAAASTATSRRTCSCESVDSADDWYDALHHVLDDPRVRERARAGGARRRADALDGPPLSKAVVSRFIGLGDVRSRREQVRA